MNLERRPIEANHGQATTVDCDALAEGEMGGDTRLGQDEPTPGTVGGHFDHGAERFDEAGEHAEGSDQCIRGWCSAASRRRR